MPSDVSTGLTLFTTAPPYRGESPAQYLAQLTDVCRWSERAGCAGMLIYTDNGLLDPWLVAQVAVQRTERLMPLVAVQPVYAHPYTIAKAVSTLSCLYGRRVCLNMVAGGFKNDLVALGDPTPHDSRYERLVEYTTVIKSLLAGGAPVSFDGRFYQVRQLALKPALDPLLSPIVTVSGSSSAGLAAARTLAAIPIQYPEPAGISSLAPEDRQHGAGIRIGVIARQSEDEAWNVAHQRFPIDRAGRVTHEIAMKVSDSVWHKQLSALGGSTSSGRSIYWLEPFEHYKTFCPYMVGDYDAVAREVALYMANGFRLFLLDVPACEEDLAHTNVVFDRASRLCAPTRQETTAHAAS